MTFTSTNTIDTLNAIPDAQSTAEPSERPEEGLVLRFFENHAGYAVGDLYLGDRRLLATTHPTTIVAALYAMGLKRLRVETANGRKTDDLDFSNTNILAAKLQLDINPRLYRYIHLATTVSEHKFLEALSIFSHETWATPSTLADEHLRAAHHHLPAELIVRRLSGPAPAGWRKTLRNRNRFVYYPYC